MQTARANKFKCKTNDRTRQSSRNSSPIDKLESEKTFHLRRNMIIDEESEGERGDTLINSGAKPVGKVYGVSLFRMYNIDKNQMMICSGHDLR